MKLKNPLVEMRIRNDAGLRNALGATFGMTRTKQDGSPKHHAGWDLVAREGTPCYAIGSGVIVLIEKFNGYGRSILLQFNRSGPENQSNARTAYAFYAHLQEASVKAGQHVKAGEMIGKTGIDGNAESAYPHLHFEIWTNPDPKKVLGQQGRYRLDPGEVLGYAHLSCKSEEIAPGLDTVKAVCFQPVLGNVIGNPF